MKKKKICFLAQFPPPIHGLSKAVDTLYNSKIANQFDLEKIDITNNKLFIKTIFMLLKSNADLFYFTISQTRLGNLRDLLMLSLLGIRHKKCLIHLHGGYYRILIDNILPKWQKKANYTAISKLEGTIVLSKSLKSNFMGMIDEDRIHIVPNCVDDEYLMSAETFEKKLIASSNKKIKHILYLSNFISSKGYLEVLKMAVLEKNRDGSDKGRKFHFDFAGKFFDPKEKKIFFDYIKQHELEDYITYYGVVSGDKKRELLKKCDIFILLTRYPMEGQPISILEAMGNGLAVVTTDHAGIPDIIENNVNGIIIAQRSNVASVAYQKILEANIQQLVSNGRKDVIQKFTQSKYIDNMCELFCKVTNVK